MGNYLFHPWYFLELLSKYIRVIYFTAAPDPPENIKAILHTKSSMAIILWTNSDDHGCFIMYNNIYYRIINERNREPWSKSTFQPNFIHRVQRYLLQVQSDKMYEVIVTAINSEGESSKELINTAIIGNVTKEPDQREYFDINRTRDIKQHTIYFHPLCHVKSYDLLQRLKGQY